MENKIKTLIENDSHLELITIKKEKNTMTKETNKTSIKVMLAEDLFIIAKQYEKKNQRITAFEIVEDDFKLSKNGAGSKIGYALGFQSHIKSFETEEMTSKGITTRDYELQDMEYKLIREVTDFTN